MEPHIKKYFHRAYGCWFDFLNLRYESDIRLLGAEELITEFFKTQDSDIRDALTVVLFDEECYTLRIPKEICDHGLSSSKRHVVLLAKLRLEDHETMWKRGYVQGKLLDLAIETKEDSEMYRQKVDILRASPDLDERAFIDLHLSQVGWC